MIVLAAILVGIASDSVHARGRLFGRRSTGSSNAGVEWTGPVGILEDDQSACQKEANHMARHGIRGHVFGVIGNFEGCGWGIGHCATCRPSWNATLTGDASAVSASGEQFRVRSWR